MSRIILPYNLQDGQKAYAARIMANFQALAGQLNEISVSGLTQGDQESVLLQMKLLLDELSAGRDRYVHDLRYDAENRRLTLLLKDGARFDVDMRPFINEYQGTEGESVAVSVDGEGNISAQLQPGGVSESQLSAALLSLISSKITANAAGNAASVRFSDGQSFQDKLDAGALKGADGVSAALSGMYYFRYDATDGHLYVGVADDAEAPPLSIDQSGHLIYTIE